MHDAQIVQLATAPSEVEGLMWANTLRDQGILVMLKPRGPGAGGWASSATFEHMLYVREEDYDRALEIVEQFTDDVATTPSTARARRAAPVVRRRSLRKPGSGSR